MSTSDQDQAVDATPEAPGTAGAKPSPAAKPRSERTRGGAEAAGDGNASEGTRAESASAGRASEAGERQGGAASPRAAQHPRAEGDLIATQAPEGAPAADPGTTAHPKAASGGRAEGGSGSGSVEAAMGATGVATPGEPVTGVAAHPGEISPSAPAVGGPEIRGAVTPDAQRGGGETEGAPDARAGVSVNARDGAAANPRADDPRIDEGTPDALNDQAQADATPHASARADATPHASAEGAPQPDARARGGLAPWQARRIRMVAAGVLMVAIGVILVVRLATRSSVLVVGVYGIALILCGVVIELSRNGRTRLASWLLVVGLAAAFGMDWFVLP
ncbi:hypothetical protein ACFYM2_05195 [Streptomyces sp. NPDC006711]|uniref:hypothetical protein n=1 Tax=Streptomyces sp. NPDC006711 TaxID=3364762 RepID=UPI003678AFF3